MQPDLQELAERAAVLEHDGGLSRKDAEAMAVGEYVDARHAAGLQIDGLLGELASADRLRLDPRVEPILRALGLQSVRASAWGFGWVIPEGGTYRPATSSESGSASFIVPCFEEGGLVDLVAEGLASGRVLPRTGAAALIGRDAIEKAKDLKEPLLVFHRASAWVRGNGLGIVPIDWENIGFELEGVGRLASNASIAARLFEATRRCWPRPTIAIPTDAGDGNAAA
jgi:hypothetical protein